MKKNLLMKQIFLVSFLLLLLNSENFGQKTLPVYDGINYAAGTLVYDAANWWGLNVSPTNDVLITSGSLSITGLLESTGNKLVIAGSGDEVAIYFGDRPADSKIYYSLIFQVTSLSGITPNTPNHFAGFINTPTSAGSFGCSIIIKADASDPSKFNVGHGTRSSLPIWNTIDGTPGGTPVMYSLNTPIFIVGCYEIIGAFLAGTPDDKSSMWINPSSTTFENLIPPTATITGDITGTAVADISVVNRFYLRQDAATTNPPIEIDEIRIGLTWASVTPKSLTTGTDRISNKRSLVDIYPNPVWDYMKVDLGGSKISFMEIYNLTGLRIMTRKLDPGTNNVNINSLPQGLYFATFKGFGDTYTRTFIKK
jgi:hypothetical protein